MKKLIRRLLYIGAILAPALLTALAFKQGNDH